MTKLIRAQSLHMSAAFVAGMMLTKEAHAANNLSSIMSNLVVSISQIPALLAAICYMFGILLGILGILKIKDHVENPGQTPLKDGAIRVAIAACLLALPIVLEAIQSMMDETGAGQGASVNSMVSIQFL